MADLGWLGVTIHEEDGGSGGGMVDACLFMEETSRGLAPIGGYAHHPDRRRRRPSASAPTSRSSEILGGIAGGSVEAIAMTEPEAGSDVGSLTTSAERVNGGFVLNGQKVFCSNAHISDHVLVVCRTTKGESKHEGLSMIFVPTDNRADGDQADRHDRRPRDQLPLPHRLRGPRRRACSARSTRAGPSSWPASTSSA